MKTSNTQPLATVTQPGTAIAMPGSATGLAVLDTINKADIVAIVRSEEEERLGQEQAALNKELERHNTTLIRLNADLDILAQDAVGKADLADAETAAAALNRAFGIKAEASAALSGRDDERKRFKVTLSVTQPSTSTYNKERETITSKEVTVPYTAKAIELLRDIKLAQKSIASVQSKLINLRREITALPTLERRAHAELTKAVLVQSEGGRQLLSKLRLTAKPANVIVAEAVA